MTKKVVVRHFHEGNDAKRKVRKTASYATQARVVDLETGKDLAQAWAFCCNLDVPSRRQGRFISVGRLCTNFPELVADAEFGVLEYLR